MTSAVAAQPKKNKFRKDHKINWWLTAVVAVLSLTILVPLYFTIVTALKTPAEAGTFALPTSWQWGNFAEASNMVNYPRAALNSAIITVGAIVLTLLTNTFVAYAVARNMDKRFFRFLYYFFISHVRAVLRDHAAAGQADGRVEPRQQVRPDHPVYDLRPGHQPVHRHRLHPFDSGVAGRGGPH